MRRFWIAMAMVAAGCDGSTPDPGCRCEGSVSGGGRLSIDCGATQCIGGTGYRCVANGRSEVEPLACPPPGSDAGTAATDAGPPSGDCTIRGGTWSFTATVRATSTRTDCTTMPTEAMVTSIDQMVGVGTCVPDCTCVYTPATGPGCVASWAAECVDGSSAGLSYQKLSDTSVLGIYQLEPTGDGTVCDFDLAGFWVR